MAARQYVPGGSSKTGLSRTRSLGVLPCGKLVPGRCAGINRHVVETESVLQEKNSKPSWPRVLRVSSRGGIRSVTRGIGGLGYGASKNLNRDADLVANKGRRNEHGHKASPPRDPAESKTPRTQRNLPVREPGGLPQRGGAVNTAMNGGEESDAVVVCAEQHIVQEG